MAGQWLSTVHLAAGNRGTAYRWSLLTHADDILGRHVQGGGGALDRLHTQFGMSAEALRALTQLAEQCRDDAEDKPDGWTRPSGFPEEVARRFAEANPAYAQQISSLEASDQFPLAQPYLVALLDEVERTQPNTKEQGDRLEELASYLFSLLPGCVPQRTTDDEDDAFESDVIVRNLYHAPNLLSDLFGRHILVECKNWERTVSVEPVGYFLFRMRITHARLGVIIAKRNITGDEKSERNARALIRRSYHEDGSICIVLDRNDIRSLIDKDVGFLALLLERAERLRFGKRRQSTSGR
jgi:hypothetical protein